MRSAWAKKSTRWVAGVAVVGVAVAGGWAAGAAGGTSANGKGSPEPKTSSPTGFSGELISYDSCAGLLDALHARGRAVVGPYGFGRQTFAYPGSPTPMALPQRAAEDSASSSPSGSATQKTLTHSSTNTQEADVDEPDVVKTDGRYMISLDGQRLRIVDVRTAKLRATLALPYPGSELLLAGDRVVVLSGQGYGQGSGQGSSGAGPMRTDVQSYSPDSSGGATTATIVDFSNADAPRVVRSWTFDAGQIAARVVGGKIRLVLSSSPPSVDWVTPRDSTQAETDRATKANQALVDATPLDAWLPHWKTSGSGLEHQVSACSAVATPPKPNGVGLVSVLTLDPLATAPGAGTSVFGAGDTAYADGRHLYVSDSSSVSAVGAVSQYPQGKAPTIHLMEFDLSDPAQARYLASGSVKGTLHDSYALSEYQDHLRVTTTTYSGESAASMTGISVLERQGDNLVVVGSMTGLGTGEQVYAVRYVGDRGYVVTFQQVDPLHVVDLSNPKKPALRGIVELPGYSSLLLPLPGHKLLGIGQSVTTRRFECPPGALCSEPALPPGAILSQDGLQLALFDVSDAAHPKLLDRRILSQAFETVSSDPHAVTIDQRPSADGSVSLVALPSTSGLLGVRISNDKLAITTAAFTVPYSVQANRTVIAGDRLFELSDRGVAVRDLPALKQTGWVSF